METVLAIDWGSKRIGTAIGNTVARMASPMQQLPNDKDAYQAIESLISEYKASRVVVGLPRNMEGEETAQSEEIRRFAEKLDSQLQLPVSLYDETLSTRAGQEMAKRFPGADKDSLAATVILQDYLDSL